MNNKIYLDFSKGNSSTFAQFLNANISSELSVAENR